MKKFSFLLKYVKTILANIRREHVGAFAAQSAFFLIMSFLPMVFLIFAVVSLSGVGMDRMYELVENLFSDVNIHVSAVQLRRLSGGPAAFVSVSTLLTAWSAGKAFKSITEGLHSVLHIGESRNYILARLRGLVYSVLFALVVGILFLVGVLGDAVYSYLTELYPVYSAYTALVSGGEKFFVFCFLFVIFTLIYTFVPDWSSYSKFGRKKVEFKYIASGSLFSSVVICAYTVIFSLYVTNYSSLSNVYGSLTTLVCVMLWLYASMYILILGFKFSCFLDLKKRNKKTENDR